MRPISQTVGPGSPPITGPMIRLDEWADAQVGVQVVVNGTANFTVAGSFDEGPDSLTNPIPVSSMAWDSGLALGIPAGAVGGSASIAFALAVAPLWLRITLNSGTGSVRMNVVQYDVVTA